MLYFQAFSVGYTGMDDKVIIQDNFELLSKFSNVKEAFTRDAFLRKEADVRFGSGFYRPMQTVSYMIDAQIGGKNPWIYHFTNLILHILTSCSIFYLLTLLGFKKEINLLLTLL